MKINYISKKILVVLLGGTIALTPMMLTACDEEVVASETKATFDEAKNSFEYGEIENLKVITITHKDKKVMYLAYEEGYDNFYEEIYRGYKYIDFFTGIELINVYNNVSMDENLEISEIDDFKQYLVGNEMIKNNYSKSEIKTLFEHVQEEKRVKPTEKVK